MKPHEPYKPKKRRNLILDAAALLFAAAVCALWIFREKLCLEISDMCILTGVSLLIIIPDIADHRRKKDIYLREVELQKQQEDIGNGDYSDSGIFFR